MNNTGGYGGGANSYKLKGM
uniref:Uncharacterized protein n=1 Tax=Anguilla anguilla TaxID=7936 RepID=A0A0E9U9B7_ANGAN